MARARLASAGLLETLFTNEHLSAREIERLIRAHDRFAIPRKVNGRRCAEATAPKARRAWEPRSDLHGCSFNPTESLRLSLSEQPLPELGGAQMQRPLLAIGEVDLGALNFEDSEGIPKLLLTPAGED